MTQERALRVLLLSQDRLGNHKVLLGAVGPPALLLTMLALGAPRSSRPLLLGAPISGILCMVLYLVLRARARRLIASCQHPSLLDPGTRASLVAAQMSRRASAPWWTWAHSATSDHDPGLRLAYEMLTQAGPHALLPGYQILQPELESLFAQPALATRVLEVIHPHLRDPAQRIEARAKILAQRHADLEQVTLAAELVVRHLAKVSSPAQVRVGHVPDATFACVLTRALASFERLMSTASDCHLRAVQDCQLSMPANARHRSLDPAS